MGATARLFMVPFVGPARLGEVADGVPPLLDGPVVPLELVPPEEPEEPPLVCAISDGATASAKKTAEAATGMRKFILVSDAVSKAT